MRDIMPPPLLLATCSGILKRQSDQPGLYSKPKSLCHGYSSRLLSCPRMAVELMHRPHGFPHPPSPGPSGFIDRPGRRVGHAWLDSAAGLRSEWTPRKHEEWGFESSRREERESITQLVNRDGVNLIQLPVPTALIRMSELTSAL
ncbi:hypothetical protein LX36DRAFT_173576 [Colletotrichum falcatum]|nr:hypothetical protein LX36DRAFT_173576 [Colletotrichum falcatum]